MSIVKNKKENHSSVSDSNSLPDGSEVFFISSAPAVLPDGNGGFTSCPELLTEEELIAFLRIPQVSTAKNYRNVVDNLKRMHGLPRIHVCGKPLYPVMALRRWIEKNTTKVK